MKELAVIEFPNGKLILTADNREFIATLCADNGVVSGFRLNPAKSHQLLEAVSQFLSETP